MATSPKVPDARSIIQEAVRAALKRVLAKHHAAYKDEVVLLAHTRGGSVASAPLKPAKRARPSKKTAQAIGILLTDTALKDRLTNEVLKAGSYVAVLRPIGDGRAAFDFVDADGKIALSTLAQSERMEGASHTANPEQIRGVDFRFVIDSEAGEAIVCGSFNDWYHCWHIRIDQ